MKNSFFSKSVKQVLLVSLLFVASFVFAQAPTISSFTPTSGVVGATVTINGTGFNTTAANNIVYFGGVKATVSSATATQIVVTVPVGGSGKVSATNISTFLTAYSGKYFSITYTNGGHDINSCAFPLNNTITTISPTVRVGTAWHDSRFNPTGTGDFNGDGKIDLVKVDGNTTVKGFGVYVNTSTGTGNFNFAVGIQVTSTRALSSLLVADFDNDGKLDVAATDGSNYEIYKNTTLSSTITFAAPVVVSAGSSFRNLMGDINGDGKMDIVYSTNYGSVIYLMLNTSSGGNLTFNGAVNYIAAMGGNRGLGVGDFNNDFKTDVVTGDEWNNGVNNGGTIQLSTSSSTVTAPTKVDVTSLIECCFEGAVESIDLNGDGKDDLIKRGYDALKISQNNWSSGVMTSANFSPVISKSLSGYTSNHLDMNGDGKIDLIGFNILANGIYSIKNNVGTTITAADLINQTIDASVVSPWGGFIGDFDLDGRNDVISLTPGGVNSTIQIYKNSPLPLITSSGTINAFVACAGSASTPQTVSISGDYLTSAITLTAPTNFEISLASGSGYAASLTLSPSSGSVSATTIYIRTKSTATGTLSGNLTLAATCATTQSISVSGTVNAVTSISAHPSSTAVSVCQNATLSALSVTAAGTSLTYQWYSNTTNSTSGATAITGATSTSYTPINSVASALYYYCVVTGTCGTVTSNISGLITVSVTPVAGTASATFSTICSGSTTTLSLTGNTGTIQWQSSANNSTWTNISGATAASYTTPALSAITYYRAIVTSGSCTAVNSNVLTITIGTNQPFGNALALNGSGKIQFANQAQSAVGANFTVEAWVNVPSAASNIQTILSNSAGIGQAGGFRFGINTWNTSDGKIVFEGGSVFVGSSVAIAKNVWQHVAVVVNNSVVSYYINGVFVGTSTGSFPPLSSTVLTLGSFSDNQYLFNGMMDEVRLWNVSKTQQEILASMYSPLSGAESALVAYFNFNQGTPGGTNTGITDLIDNGPNALTGSLSEITRTGTAENFVANANPMAITGSLACVGSTVQLYHPQSGGTWSSATTGVASITSTGLVSCLTAGSSVISYVYTYNGCQFTNTYTMTVNATPVAPTVTTTSVSYCQNATATALVATAATSHTLRWYTVASGGTGSTTAITPVTSTAGTVTYYVSQANASGCEGPRVAITVTVSPTSVAGTASVSASAICGGSTVDLSLTGNTGTVQWQSSPNNSTWTPITGATAANFTTSALNATTYFRAVVTSGGCTAVNSNVLTVTVTTVAVPTTTTINISECQGNTATQLSATALSGHTLQWYTVASGGTANTTAITPDLSTAGLTTYYVSQLNNTSNCESTRVPINVTVYALPAAPTTTTTINYCQGATATALVATSQSGFSLQWYTAATGGTASASAPTPTTTTAGTTTYYVSQKQNTGTYSLSTAHNSTIPYGTNQGQTFQVANNVVLNTITLTTMYWASASTAVMKIYNGFGGSLIATANNTFNSVALHNNNVTFSFANQNLLLNSGQTYYFEITSPQNFYVWANSSSVLATGAAYLNGAIQANSDLSFTLQSALFANPCESSRTAIVVNVNEVPTISGVQNMTLGGSSLQLTGSGTPATTNPWVSSNTNVATISSTGEITAIAGGSTVITYTNTSGCSISQSITVVDCSQPLGNVLHFDGVNDYITTASNLTALNITADLTIETWIKYEQTHSDWVRLIGKGDSTNRTYGLWLGTDGKLLFQINGTPTGLSMNSTSSLQTGIWYHIAATRNGNTAKIYINGVEDATASTTVNPQTNTFPLTVGYGTIHTYLKGSLEDVRVWNIARSVAQIQQGMYNTVTGNESGLVVCYDFNQGTSGGNNTAITTANDKTPNAINATLTNFGKTGATSNFIGNTILNFSVSGDSILCANSTSQFTHPRSGGTWSISNGANATINASGLVTALENENVTISYTYTINGCSVTDSKSVSINTPAAPVATSPVNLCIGATATALTATVSSGSSLLWYATATGGTSSGTAPIPSTTSIGSATYYVSQKAPSGPFIIDNTYNGSYANNISTFGQSFTSPNNIKLNSITLKTAYINSNSPSIVLKVYNGYGGALIATANNPYTNTYGYTWFNDLAFSFSGQNIALTGGQTYYFEFVPNATMYPGYSNAYTNGTGYIGGGVISQDFAFKLDATINSNPCESARTAIVVNVNANPTITGVQNMTLGGATLQLTGSGTPATTNPWVSSNSSVATISATGEVTAVAGGTTTITYTNASGCTITAIIRVIDCNQPFGNSLAFGIGTTAANADFVDVNSRIFPNNTVSNFTIETWIKPSASDIVAGTPGSTSWFGFLGAQNSQRNPSMWITNSGALHASWWDNGYAGTPVNASTPSSLVADRWTHVALVKDGTTMRIYANGIQINSASCSATITVPNNNYWLGKVDNQFNGSLDEVRFWSTARSQSDILATMNTELTGTETGLLAYFDFNQGVAGGNNTSITTVTNKANSALNGTLTNFTRSGTSSNFVGSTISSFDITGPATICANTTAQYSHLISGGTWSVSNGANATVSASGLLTSAANENITLSYTYTINGCSVTATRSIAINSPAAPVTTTTINYCIGGTTTALSATAVTGNTIQWYTVATGGTASTTAPTPSASTAGATIYYVSQKNNTTNCESSRTAITVTVNAIPTITGIQSITLGGATLQLTGSGTAATTNPWVSSATGIATISNTGEVTAVAGGTTSITYTASSGCSISQTLRVIDCDQPYNNSLSFDGIDDYVVLDNVGTNTNFQFTNTSSYSIEAWVKRNANTTNSSIILSKQNGGVAGNYSLGLSSTGVPYLSREAAPWVVNATSSIPINEWHHIAGVFDGSTLKIYIDGLLNNSIAASGNITPSSVTAIKVAIGAMYTYNSPTNFFNGSIDEARVWNVARTASQISQNFSSSLQGNETGLVAYYDFNHGIAGGNNASINTVINAVNSASNGNLSNFAKTGTASNFVNSVSTIEIKGSSTICGNATSQYTHLIPGGTWSVSSGAAASISTAGLLTTLGAENITLTYDYTLNGCAKSATKSISVVVPSITVEPSTATQNICINGSATSLSITATNINTTYQWYKNSAASNTGGTLITGATTSGYTPLSNVAGTNYYYCVIGGTCLPNVSSTVSGAIIISPTSVAGTITANATICSGTTTTLNLSGNVGNIQWQQLDNSTWTDIAGATSAAFTTPALTQSTSYRALVTSGSCSAVNTNSYNVVVNNAPAITSQPSTLAQNVCLNGITSSLSVSATGAGLTYQWYKNTTVTTTGGTLISGATFSVYMPSNNLSGTTYYYCVVSGTCSPAVTSDVSGAINISPTSVAGNILGATSVCTGTNSTVLTLSGNVGAIQWQSSTNNVTFINIAGETSSTYTATNLTATTYYRSVVTSGSCAAINTATINITVTPLPVISGNTSVGLGDAINLSATTAAASSNAWVSSTPSVASVSNTGVVNGLSIGTTTITYTNSIGCTDTEIITVVGGTTQIPTLTLPATNTSGATTLNFNYTLPETPLAGSVRLIITPSAGGTPIVWNMNNATSANFNYVVGSDPTTISNIVSGTSLGFTTYSVTLVYQDAFGNPAASVTNTNIQTLAPPVISFANANYNGIINQPISIQTVNNGGGMVTYTIAPALPAGLSLNATTGLISGTPTVTLAATTFTVTANNAAGTDTESFILFIDADTDGDGIGNATDTDIDGDGTLNAQDTNPTNPCIGFNASTASLSWQNGDCDGDGISNGSDADVDGNGSTDNGSDTDGDGINDANDPDIDGDGILNGVDSCPTIVNTSIVTQPSTQTVNLCQSTVPFTLTVSAVGQQLTYQWYSNSSNSNVGGTVISGATTATYVPTTSYVSRYYYVVVSGTCGTVTSNVSGAITINPISVAGTVAGATTICSGTNATVLTLSGNTGTIQWQSSTDNITFTNIASATTSTYTATNLTATTYYRAVVTSGVCSSATTASVTITVSPTSVAGTIAGATSVCSGTNSTVLTLSGNTGTIQWQSSTDNITFTNIASATSSTYTATNSTATTYYRAVVTSGVCSSATTASVTITVSPISVAGTIAGATTVCSGTNATVLTLSGNTGTIQWQSSTDNNTFTNIASATTSTYTATNLTATTYYRAVVTSGVCSSATSAAVTITVSPTSVAGTISGATSVCSGTNSTVLTLSGNTGTIQWQSSTDNITFTNIASATTSTFTATNLTATTYYRAVVTSGVCSSATTASVSITVSPTSLPGSIAGATSVCSGANSTVLTLSGNTGTIQWQWSTDSVTFFNIPSATTSTYTATNLTATTYYRAVVTSGVCSSATTTVSTIIVNPTSVAGSIAGANTVCSGTNSTVLTLSGNTGTIQWQSSTNNVTFTNITGATAATFTATNLTATTYFRALVTSGVCSSATTAFVIVTVSPTSVAGSIAGATTVCSGINTTVLSLSGNTGTIQWQSSTDNNTFTNIASATTSNFTATNVSATTYYRVVVTSGVCSSATSAVATITYIPIVAPTAVSNQQFCYLNNPTVSNLVTTSGVGIKWYATATGGTPLTGSTPLVTATTYYASQTISVCESPIRVAVTVLLTCPVDAIADNFGSINGYAGATTASVLTNDTINGGPLLSSQIILSGVAIPTGLTLNANGTITIAPQTAAGTYNVTYRICEVLNPNNCDTVTFPIIVGTCLDFAINDCDLDGESNGTETANGTNPSDACSFTNPPASNNAVYPTWSVLDCDGDGVINGQEIIDGTSPTNPCESNPINITIPLSTSFINGDCDSDGLTNGDEIGSNVNYPNDSNGNGIPDYLEINNHSVSEDNLEVYSSLTPNGDGNNDVLIIRNIENYPENNVSIFNRWGITVYDVDGYGQDNKYFKGISEGRITINSQDELPIGTYFYIIKYKNNNGEQKQRSGYLYINR
jgi:gliding motility-associated-like protein